MENIQKKKKIKMKKARQYFLFTLGCQMNISDSQRITQKLKDIGYKAAPNEKGADLLIINSCSVRQKAVDRIWGTIRNWQKYKENKILITGCVLPADQKKLKQKKIEFFNIKNLSNLENILKQNYHTSEYDKFSYFTIRPKIFSKIAYIPIMTGCDNFCSYCAVPYTRGREKSRLLKDILNDVQNALKNGSNNILLLGQNVNSYQYEFSKLLKKVDNLPYDFTFNFMSSNPHDISDDLIETFAELKKWPRELHLAMQSGDDVILKKMNRKYTSDQFLKLVKNLKYRILNLSADRQGLKITTDIIVGFPSETKGQFNNTLKICKKIGFKKAYISQYSPRSETVAAKLNDDVSKEEKKRRWEILDNLINK